MRGKPIQRTKFMKFSPVFLRFLRYARPYAPLIIGAIICGLLKFSLALSLPGALGVVMDHVLLADLPRDQKIQRLIFILTLLTLAFLGRAPTTYYRSYLATVAGSRAIFDIRLDLYRHLQRLSMTYHATRRTGGTISRLINDLNTAQGILNEGIVAIAMDVLFLSGVVVFLFYWDWRLAAVSLTTLPLYGLVFRFLNPRLREVATEVQEEMQELSGEVTEKISAVQVIISFTREKTEQIKFFRRHRKYYSTLIRRERLKVLLTTVAEFLTEVGPIVVICYGGYRVINGTLSPGALLIFNGFLAHLYLPTRRLADYSAKLQEKLSALERVFEVLDSPPDIKDLPGAVPLLRPKGRVEFRNVHFAYDPQKPVLQGINLIAEPGQSVAIVGRSGAGKTTVVNLIPRFYDPTEGCVLVDNRDIRTLTVRSLRDNIGIVLQDSILFSGTIKENILYGRHNATEREMIRAAEMAQIAEFIESLPDGYDTIVGERGVMLSGGQRQRISIARAFLRDPRILILDEATSNLDSGAEQAIQEALSRLMKGRTTFVIAHRLSTVINCDKVIVLDAGRVVQEGTHAQLIQEKGPYRTLCEEQFGAIRLDVLSRKVG